MMKIISKRPIAFMQNCTCGCVFSYEITDIYQNKYVYCPLCRTKLTSNCDLSYDGVIKDDSISKKEK